MTPPTYFPLRWESTGDQWWYASPIDWAAANGYYDLVRELLRLDGNHLIKLTSLRRIRRLETVWDDEEQFHDVTACRSDVARKLLAECQIKKGKNSLIGGGYGGWLLYTAASAGDSAFVRELLERDPLLVFGEGEYGVTDILYAAARSKSEEVFKVVLDFAAAPRFAAGEEQAGEIPAAYKLEIMNRAIHAAARGGNLQLLRELLRDCSDDALAYRDVGGATVLHAAAARGQVQVVTDLTSSPGLIDATDNQGNTALHVAAQRGHLAVVEALILASPSSISATNNNGETFLHAVVSGFQTPGFHRLDRQIELMKHLLSGKLFPVVEIINAKNSQGRTPLHLAILANTHSNLVELLMTVKSIDVNIRDKDGATPLDILRQRPLSASSELLTRHLISAGGIFTSQDYSARRVIASHIKRQSMGSSPGTSFRISDVEIFLYTGLENVSDGSRSVGLSSSSPEVVVATRSCKASAAQRLKRLLHWPKRVKKPVREEGVPVPLRQRFSKPASSLSSNKRTLSVRSSQPSPTAKKRLASGVMHGVMQAIPRGAHRSRSSSFSKISFSSQGSLDAPPPLVEHEAPNEEGARRHGVVNRRLVMNQYLCFGGPSQGSVEAPETYEVYERSVLAAA
ncbi:kinase D-interacting substrate of 220 kDa-like protein [Salvia divinorum]|uniref:Kinase D-interacting substrate of 220 kDa-like protein n=1 Tax=Salvia divinorum TaxID=28513 RepID=A0ABD1I6B3_SALDI